MIHEKAMLVSLMISQWTARKYDKKVSTEVEKANSAHDAGRFNKILVSKDALKAIDHAASAARVYHYEHTMPWGDNGERLLPSKLFLDYNSKMHGLVDAFNIQASIFAAAYPTYVQDARTRLGQMYHSEDYPDVRDIRRRFKMSVGITPVPKASDFRVDVGDAEAARIRTEIEDSVREREKAAVQDCFKRAREVVEKMQARLSDSEAVFRDSLVQNVRDVIAILPAMNITDDPTLDALCKDMQESLTPSPERLRNDEILRSETAQKARAILAKFKLVEN